MARQYRLGPTRRAFNLVVKPLLRLGLPVPQRTSYLMTTTGRKSGRERTTPVNLVLSDEIRWLVSPYGNVGWAHNLRGDPQLRLRRGRHTESFCAVEVTGPEAAAILRRYVAQVPITAPFFDAKKADPVEAFAAEAERHPVFRLEAAHTPDKI